MRRFLSAALLCLAIVPAGALLALHDPETDVPSSDPDDETPADPLTAEALLARLNGFGAALAAASPRIETAASSARDEAAKRLSRLALLIDSGQEHVLWGTLTGDDPLTLDGRQGWAVSSLAAVKLNLSMFMFPGGHRVEAIDDLLWLRVPAQYRDGLTADEHPAPLWMDTAAWRAHVNATEVVLAFRGETLLAILVRGGPEGPPTPAAGWNADHPWSDSKEGAKASRFAALLSVENPEAAGLKRAYRGLSAAFEQHGCLACHVHGSNRPSKRQFILNVENDVLAVRDSLPELLAKTEFAEDDPHRASLAPLQGGEELEAFRRAAEMFGTAANHALSYEAARRAVRTR